MKYNNKAATGWQERHEVHYDDHLKNTRTMDTKL